MTRELDDTSLLAAFEDHSLPFDQWTHRAHLRVAFLYVRGASLDEATARLRSGIRAYNAAHGVFTTPTRGYHETITCAWASVVARALADGPPCGDSATFLSNNPHLLNPKYLEVHYEPGTLACAEARATYVTPDRRPLPGGARAG